MRISTCIHHIFEFISEALENCLPNRGFGVGRPTSSNLIPNKYECKPTSTFLFMFWTTKCSKWIYTYYFFFNITKVDRLNDATARLWVRRAYEGVWAVSLEREGVLRSVDASSFHKILNNFTRKSLAYFNQNITIEIVSAKILL